jgi:hypothetical protein
LIASDRSTVELPEIATGEIKGSTTASGITPDYKAGDNRGDDDGPKPVRMFANRSDHKICRVCGAAEPNGCGKSRSNRKTDSLAGFSERTKGFHLTLPPNLLTLLEMGAQHPQGWTPIAGSAFSLRLKVRGCQSWAGDPFQRNGRNGFSFRPLNAPKDSAGE